MRLLMIFVAAVLLSLCDRIDAGDPGAVGDLYVSGESSDNVVQFDGQTGEFVCEFVPQVTPPDPPGHSFSSKAQGLSFGPNGNLFVVARDAHRVREFDGETGALVGEFSPFDDPAIYTDNSGPSGGWLSDPYDLVFRPDGNLLVVGNANAAILAYAASSAQWLGTFAVGGSCPGGLGGSQFLTLGPNGHVFAASGPRNQVFEYHPTTGQFVRAFGSPGELDWPNGVAFGPNGNLFVISFWDNSVVEFDLQTGTCLGTFASGGGLTWPRDLTFGPNGNLFVSSNSGGGGVEGVIEYDGATGAVIGTFATSGQLSRAWGLTFKPAPPEAMPTPGITGVSVSQVDACQGLVGLAVSGSNLDPEHTMVKLSHDDEPAGSNGFAGTYFGAVAGGSPDGTSLIVDFDLNGGGRMAGGPWDVVVVNPDGQMDTLASAIEVAPCYAAVEENLFVLGYRHRLATRHGLFEYDGASGNLVGFAVEDSATTLSGEDGDLYLSSGFAFGHGGNVLITSRNPGDGSVLEYDGITGRKLGTFIPAGMGGMLIPRKLTFGPNGNLFVLHRGTNGPSGILEFDALTGAFVRDFVPFGSCGLFNFACDFEFGSNGNLYVTDCTCPSLGANGGVYLFDGQIGECLAAPLIPVFPEYPDINTHSALEFSPHNGNLVLPWRTPTAPPGAGLGRVTEHDPETGELLATPIPPPADDIEQAYASDLGPSGHLFVASYPDYVFEYDLVSSLGLGLFATQVPASGGGWAAANEIMFRRRAGDANGDWDLDLADFGAFQRCFSGEGVTPGDYNCLTFDHDRDGDVDLDDLAGFTAVMTGPATD